jgi:hypothetical protein
MASRRIGKEAEWVNGRSNVLYINEGLDSGSMVRSLAGGLSTIVIGSLCVVGVGLLPADWSNNGSQE